MYLVTVSLDRFRAVAVLENKDSLKELMIERGWVSPNTPNDFVVKWDEPMGLSWGNNDVYYGTATVLSEVYEPYHEPYYLEAFPLPIADGFVIISD